MSGENPNDGRLPLEGVRVLDLARLIAGGYLGTLLGDFGADVVKIEAPGTGDPLRAWAANGKSLWWKVYARNKRSMALDLSRAMGREVLLELVPSFDVLIESFVPGKLESWGLAPEVLLERNPKLVIVRASGWGQTGAYHDRPGFGTLIEAMSGFAAMTGLPDGPPTLPPLPLADMVTALYGAVGTMVALYHRDRADSAGQVIDLSIFEPMISILGPLAAEYERSGFVPERIGNRSLTNAPRNTYRSSDGGWVAMSAATQAMAEKTFRAIRRPDLIDDPRFRTNALRMQNVEELDTILQDSIGAMNLGDALDTFRDHGVTASPVYDVAQLVTDEHVLTRDVLVDIDDAELGVVKMHNIIPRLSRTPGQIRSTGPNLSEHGAEVLKSFGFTEESVSALLLSGIVGGFPPGNTGTAKQEEN